MTRNALLPILAFPILAFPILAFPILAFPILACGIIIMGCDGGSGSGRSVPVAERYPIDGVVDFSAFQQVDTATVSLFDSLGAGALAKTVTLRYAFVNDDRHVYLALEWTDDTYNNGFDPINGLVDFDSVALDLDVDGDGLHGVGEDTRFVIAAIVGSFCSDQHVTAGGDVDDVIGDGQARLTYDPVGQLYQAEFLVPIADDANGEDGLLTALTRFNIVIMDNVELAVPSGNLGGLATPGSISVTWPTLPLDPDAKANHPVQPSNLTGLIAYVSVHEEPKGEIYTYDPASGVTVRVTTDPTLFKSAVSLSHDRTRIAFHGAPDRTDFANYEIYTINVNGTGLTQLTTNAILDGHPGWSPDDSRIAYASFREPGKARIVVMTAAGTEIAELTPAGTDDNDPDYLPDGRIVFKTDRFSVAPEVRIAVMNEDGTGVLQLTALSGSSDHDPVGNGTHAVFERFPKGTDYATDPEALLTPWLLIEARLDGGGERTLLSDPWVNWLPVYDPGAGQHLVYLKTVGTYTEARLLRRNGQDLGRLIPDATRLEYVDWK